MSETELDLARRIAAGTARSPTATPEYTWFAMRWSGTDADGLAWRAQFNEHVQRPAETTLAPEMVERLSGVPLVFLHPPKGTLDSQTFEQSIIGMLAFGYVATTDGFEDPAGTELWAMCRVYDADAIAALKTGELRITSPAVSFSPAAGNETIKLQDGSHVLREKVPDCCSHLAVVPAGVWDRGAGPSGCRIDSTEEKPMAEQPAKDIKPDESLGEPTDKLLKHLDAKFDALHQRMNAIEGKRADADPERDAWAREDAAACARDDAEEAAEREAMEGKGEAKQVAADRARQARRDRVRARKDAAQHRQDSAALTATQAAALRQQQADNADVQARADAVCGAWGERAPPPMQSETTSAYRIRLLRAHQMHSPDWKGIDLGTVPDAVLNVAENKIYADSATASANPIGPDDRLIQRTKVDEITGHRITTFHGRHTFIHGLKRPSMRATAFMTPNHRAA